jgi:hypothetical protein
MNASGLFAASLVVVGSASPLALAQRKPDSPPPLLAAQGVPQRYEIAQREVLARLENPPPQTTVVVQQPAPVVVQQAAPTQVVLPPQQQVIVQQQSEPVIVQQQPPQVVVQQPAPVVVQQPPQVVVQQPAPQVVYAAPQVVYAAPQVIYAAPEPVYVSRPVVVCPPPRPVCPPAVVYRSYSDCGPRYVHRGWGHGYRGYSSGAAFSYSEGYHGSGFSFSIRSGDSWGSRDCGPRRDYGHGYHGGHRGHGGRGGRH